MVSAARRLRYFIPVLLFAFLQSSAVAATYYAAANGTSTAGTSANPWSIEYAVGKVSNPTLQPGDTVIIKDGTYVCTENSTVYSTGHVLEFHKSGTPTAKITYKSEHLWGASFDGGLLFPETVTNVVVQGVRVFYSGSVVRERTDVFTHPAGINVYGEGVEVLHNLIENTGHPGIGSWKTTKGKYIAGNIIRFTGFYDFTGSYAGAERGSGMYLQNQDNSNEALIEGNITYFNNTTGLKAYGNSDIWGFKFYHQICAENNEAGIFYHLDNYGSVGVKFIENYIWGGRPGIRIGYPLGNGGHENAVVTNNYVVDDYKTFYLVDGWSHMTFTGNVGVNFTPGAPMWFLEVFGETSGDIASHTMSGNTYYSAPGSANVFPIKETATNFDTWKQMTGQDASSTWQYGTPATLKSFVFKPSRDPDFVHVAVYNWPQLAETSVDLSSYFSVGDKLSIFDAQAIPSAYSSITYAGGTVKLDLTRTTLAPMNGTFGDRVWSGFDSRFRAFVIYRTNKGNAPAAPSNLRFVH